MQEREKAEGGEREDEEEREVVRSLAWCHETVV